MTSLETGKERGDALMRAGDYRAAAEAYRQCLRGADSAAERALYARVCANASLACARCGRAPEALLYAERALAVDAAEPKALYRKAHALRLLGNLTAADAVLGDVEARLRAEGRSSPAVAAERAALQHDIDQRGTACALAGMSHVSEKL